MRKKDFILVSRQMLEEKLPVGFMYNEGGYNAGDSGWRVTSGQESALTLCNPDNSIVADYEDLIHYAPETEEFLKGKKGTVVQRVDGQLKLIGVDKSFRNITIEPCRMFRKGRYIKSPGVTNIVTQDAQDMKSFLKKKKETDDLF